MRLEDLLVDLDAETIGLNHNKIESRVSIQVHHHRILDGAASGKPAIQSVHGHGEIRDCSIAIVGH